MMKMRCNLRLRTNLADNILLISARTILLGVALEIFSGNSRTHALFPLDLLLLGPLKLE